MPMEVAGSLIEMNVHNVAGATASVLIDISVIGIIVSIVVAAMVIISDIKDKKEALIATTICVVIAIGLLIVGSRMPKVKEINYCANGPVQIEQIAAKYDIVGIDGKQITVRERGK
jgi:high-affinity Fe2+/Pb2+ permease